MLVDKMTYEQAIRSIRELVLDTNPVRCLTVTGQDFFFKKDSNGVVIAEKPFTFGEVGKFYELVEKLFEEPKVTYGLTEDYVATEPVKTLNDVEFTLTSAEPTRGLYRKQYFSNETIENAMIEAFPYLTCYVGYPRYTLDIFNNDLDYFDRRKLVLLTAYFLLDRRRMQTATATELIRKTNEINGVGDPCGGDGEIKNTSVSVTTRIGEVFTVNEKVEEDGKGLEGFTSLWGDKYSYLTKLQLYIRGLYEKQFGDFSLRDDAMRSSGFYLEKGWETSAWIDTINFSRTTLDILLPDNRL